MKDLNLMNRKKMYFPIIGLYLDEVQKKNITIFSRIEIVNYINEYVEKDKQIIDINNELDLLIKEFYNVFATPSQKVLLELRMVNDYIMNVRIIDPLAVDTYPMSLDIELISEQKNRVNQLFVELDKKTEIKTIQPFNVRLEEITNRINLLKEEEVFSITGSSKVEAVYNYAQVVYESYIHLIECYAELRSEIQRLFNDFSELRDNLRYLREDFFVIVKCLLGKELDTSKIKLFNFMSVEWLEYADIQDDLDLKFDNIQERCSTFYSFIDTRLEEVGDVFNKHLNNIGNNLSKKGYNSQSLKTDMVAGGISLAFSAVKGVLESRTESKIVVEKLRKDIEFLKLGFSNDKLALQNDLFRLIELYNTVKNIFIPVSQKYSIVFFDVIESVLSKENIKLIEDLGVLSLLQERTIKLEELRSLKLYVLDKENICKELSVYKDEAKLEYDKYLPLYEFALSQKPEKSLDIICFLTLGLSNIYFKAFDNEWNTAFRPIEENYTLALVKFEEENSRYKVNYLDLETSKDNITTLANRVEAIEDEIKILLVDKNIGELLLKKIHLLEKLATSSRTVLEVSIQEELVSPELYIKSFEGILSNDDLLFNTTNTLVKVDENDRDFNFYGKLTNLINKVEYMPSFDEIVSHCSKEIAEENNDLNIEQIQDVLRLTVNKLELEDYSYKELKQKLIDVISDKTVLNENQVLEFLDLGKRYLVIMEEVLRIRKEVDMLQKMNISNDERIENQLMILSGKVRLKIDSINRNKEEFFAKIEENSSSEEKLEMFINYLKNN